MTIPADWVVAYNTIDIFNITLHRRIPNDPDFTEHLGKTCCICTIANT